jgi:ribosomal protein L44E
MRIGDEIDDYCSRCKRITDHNIVSLESEEPQKTRCRTCQYEHKYKKNKGGRTEMSAKEAFDKVLSSVMGGMPSVPEPKKKRKRT